MGGNGGNASGMAERVADEQLAGPGSNQAKQGPYLRGPLDLGELAYVSGYEIRYVGVEEVLPPSIVRSPDRFRESPADDPLGVITSAHTRLVAKSRTVPEHSIHEMICLAVDLALRERPQLDCLSSPGESIGKRLEESPPGVLSLGPDRATRQVTGKHRADTLVAKSVKCLSLCCETLVATLVKRWPLEKAGSRAWSRVGRDQVDAVNAVVGASAAGPSCAAFAAVSLRRPVRKARPYSPATTISSAR